MKNIIKSLALAALCAASFSCAKNETSDCTKGEGQLFSIRTSECKTFIVAGDGKYTPNWEKGDNVKVIFGDPVKDSNTPKGPLSNVNENGVEADFQGHISSVPEVDYMYVFYPAEAYKSVYSDNSVGLVVSTTQSPSGSSFDPAADILVSKKTEFGTEGDYWVAYPQFARVISMLKINVFSADYAKIQGEKLNKFTVEVPEAELAGNIAIDLTKEDGKIVKVNSPSASVSAVYDDERYVSVGTAGTSEGCSVFLNVVPGTWASGTKLTFSAVSAGYTITKEITLTSDIVLNPGKLTEINLSIAEENCKEKQDLDYSGKYLIVSGKILLTDYNADNKYYNYISADGTELSDFWEIADIENYVWTVAKLPGDSYSLRNAGSGKYMALTASSNNAHEAEELGEYTAFAITEVDTYLTINSQKFAGRNLRYNSSSPRFAFYSTSTGNAATLLAYTSDPRTPFDAVSGLKWDSSSKTISWTAVDGAANGYEYTTDNGTTIVAVESNSVDCSSWTNGDYSVKVRVVGTEEKKISEWSEACEFTITGGAAAKYYRKVTEGLGDWSGEYLLVYESSATDAYIWTGVDVANCYATTTISDNSISSIPATAVTLTIATMEGGYSIKVNGGANDGKYICGTSGSNALSFKTTECLNTISYQSGSVLIVSNTSVMRYNSASNNDRFRYFKSSGYSSQQPVQLYKFEEAVTSVVVSGTPSKLAYKAGDNFETEGLKVTAILDAGDQKDVTSKATWTITPAGPLAVGTTSVSVVASYNGVSSEPMSITGITVTEPAELTSISVKTAPSKVEYFKGEKFDPAGLVVYRNYSDETKDEYAYAGHESDFTFNPALTTALTTDINNVTITYQGKSVGQAITVKSIANTKETAYTVAQARALIDAGKDLETQVYVKGKVSEIVTAYSSSYGNISFNVSDNGSKDGDQFQFYRNFKGADKAKWTDADTKPAVGNEVIGFGTMKKFGDTYEFAEGNYIVSIVQAPYLNATATKTSGISADGEEITINVDTNLGSWEVVSSDNTNFKVGTKTATSVKITVTKNTDAEKGRTATITVSAEGVDDVVITLTQSKVGKSNVTFGSDWNSLFGTSYTGTFSPTKNSLALDGTANGASITVTNGSSTNGYIKTSDFRAYNGYTITLTAPTGKNITAISSTKGGKNFSSGVSANVGTVSISNNTISWTGSSNSVVLSISGTVSFATITLTCE
ncbi:MAG: hypothetical protein MJY62_00440 [Bacteroidales bacterium]|nr:hypothetical protein [Bacteroidales bacterium]